MASCIDITADYVAGNPGFASCLGNLTWAKESGLQSNPEFYTNYTKVGLSGNSSLADWQCVLADKVGPGGGEGWGCPAPCSASLPGYCVPVDAPSIAEDTTAVPTLAPTLAPTAAPTNTTTAAPTTTLNVTTTTAEGASSSSLDWSGSSSLEWYWIALIALALCGAAAAAYFLMSGGSKKRGPEKKKKKRAAAPPPQAEAPAVPLLEPQPVVTTSQPVYYTTAAPVYQAAPVTRTVQAAAAPVYQYSAAPAVGSSFVMASAPVATMSTPISTYGVQPGAVQGANFDMLDRNHDGVISRDEFNAMRR